MLQTTWIDNRIVEISWDRPCDAESLGAMLTDEVQTLLDQGAERIECRVPTDDVAGRHGVHLARFRREGRLRAARSDGDVYIYSIIAGDATSGRQAFTAMLNTIMPTHRVIGHVLFTDADGHVLLLETSYKPDWELPGGIIEPHEPPRIGAQREVAEELGLDVELDQPLIVDWMPPYLGWDDAVEFIFDGGVLTQEQKSMLYLPDAEIRQYHWVHPDEIDGHVTELSARRIRRMLARPADIYTESGRSIGEDATT